MATHVGEAAVSAYFTLTSYNRPAAITFGVNPTSEDPAAVNAAVFDALTTTNSLCKIIDSNVILTRIRVAYGVDGTEDLIDDRGYSFACLASGTAVPPNVAVLVHKRTQRGGRRGRGRMFLPWTGTLGGVNEDGTIAPTNYSSYQAAVTVFFNRLTTNAVPMVLLHQPGLSAPGLPNLVTSLQVDPVVSTQRRRLGR
jgi:hypothetical protein